MTEGARRLCFAQLLSILRIFRLICNTFKTFSLRIHKFVSFMKNFKCHITLLKIKKIKLFMKTIKSACFLEWSITA